MFCGVPANNLIYDVVSKCYPSSTEGTWRTVITNRKGGTSNRSNGVVAIELDVGARFKFPTGANIRGNSITDKITLLALAEKAGTTNGICTPHSVTEYQTDGHGFSLSFDDNSFSPAVGGPVMAGNALGVGGFYSNNNNQTSDNADPSDQVHFFGFGTDDSGANLLMMFRGTTLNVTGSASLGSGADTSFRYVSIGGTAYSAGQAAVTTRVALALIFARKLTPFEYAILYANPWIIFRPMGVPLFYGTAGAGGTNATVNGQLLTATSSMILGAAAAGSQVSGQTISVVASLLAGSVSADSQVNGQTLTAVASMLAGAATSGVIVNGQTLTAIISLLSGSVSSGSQVNGQLLSAVASLIAGSAFSDAAVNGQLLSAVASIISGAGSAGSQVNGQTLSAVSSLLAGTAAADGGATVAGQLLTVLAQLAATGVASGNVLGQNFDFLTHRRRRRM